MLGLQWHRFSCGQAACETWPQDLPAAMPEMQGHGPYQDRRQNVAGRFRLGWHVATDIRQLQPPGCHRPHNNAILPPGCYPSQPRTVFGVACDPPQSYRNCEMQSGGDPWNVGAIEAALPSAIAGLKQ